MTRAPMDARAVVKSLATGFARTLTSTCSNIAYFSAPSRRRRRARIPLDIGTGESRDERRRCDTKWTSLSRTTPRRKKTEDRRAPARTQFVRTCRSRASSRAVRRPHMGGQVGDESATYMIETLDRAGHSISLFFFEERRGGYRDEHRAAGRTQPTFCERRSMTRALDDDPGVSNSGQPWDQTPSFAPRISMGSDRDTLAQTRCADKIGTADQSIGGAEQQPLIRTTQENQLRPAHGRPGRLIGRRRRPRALRSDTPFDKTLSNFATSSRPPNT